MSLFRKKLTFLLIVVGLAGAIVWQVSGVDKTSYEARFTRAMKLMEGLQSRAIPVAFTEDEIDLLEGVYQDSLVRLPNVTAFRNTDKGKLIDVLKANSFSGGGTNGLNTTGENILTKSLGRVDEFKAYLGAGFASDIGITNTTGAALIKKHAQSINTLTNDVRLTMLYISWYEALRGTLCTTDDVNNDIYTLGTLSFKYGATTALVDSCSDNNITLKQHRCVLGQYKDETNYTTTTTCANGCSNGACIRESQSGFVLAGTDTTTVGETYSLDVKATNASGQTDTGYSGTFFVIIDGDDDAIFPTGALTMSGTGMKTVRGIKFSQEGIMTITVRSTDGYEASKTVVVGTDATKNLGITCREIDGDLQLEYSNGSTNFEGRILALGQADPNISRFEVEYTQTEITFRADMYVDGTPIACPAVTLPNEEGNSEAPLETCEQILQDLRDEGQNTNGINCTGEHSYSVEKANN